MTKTPSYFFQAAAAALSCTVAIALAQDHMGVTKAVAILQPTKGNQASGLLHFAQSGEKVKLTGEITGLTPGLHGFHIHEFGDCSADDGASAGPHFDPHKVSHGGPADQVRHTGDLGNITADKEGRAVINTEDSVIALSGHMSIMGRGVIVHAQPDDLKSQPTGNAGGRVACGVVGVAKSE